jgi:hypothetical protein
MRCGGTGVEMKVRGSRQREVQKQEGVETLFSLGVVGERAQRRVDGWLIMGWWMCVCVYGVCVCVRVCLSRSVDWAN